MSVYTSTQITSDSGDRQGVKPSLIVLHHTAFVGSIQSLVNLMMPGGRTVSAHAAIKDNNIVNVVPESRRSFSLGAAIFERRVLSAECVNSTAGPSWLLSDATHNSIALWVADVCKRHGIRPHRDGPPSSWTVIGHREVSTIHQAGYATACPGGMDLNRIVRLAQTILEPKRKLSMMPILVPLVVGNPPSMNGDYALVGDGGVVGLRAREDAAIINTARRAMLDGQPIYGNQADELQALFARVAAKPATSQTPIVAAATSAVVDYAVLAQELAKVLPPALTAVQIAAEVIRQQKLPGN